MSVSILASWRAAYRARRGEFSSSLPTPARWLGDDECLSFEKAKGERGGKVFTMAWREARLYSRPESFGESNNTTDLVLPYYSGPPHDGGDELGYHSVSLCPEQCKPEDFQKPEWNRPSRRMTE